MSNWEKSLRPLFGVSAAALLGPMTACSPELDLARWSCRRAITSSRAADAGPIDVMQFDDQWSTGFENGDCDYFEGNGSCYTSGPASYRMVQAPVHGGQYAAAFTVTADDRGRNTESRCHRDGVLPPEARYDAWFYIPALSENLGNWNLIHFQGGVGPDHALNNLWDISLVNNGSGGLRLGVFDYVPNSSIQTSPNVPAVPIGLWFHIEVLFKRASDPTGKFEVYQDGTPILQASDIITDHTPYGQWYVGNLATRLSPAESTIYVDDVSVRAVP